MQASPQAAEVGRAAGPLSVGLPALKQHEEGQADELEEQVREIGVREMPLDSVIDGESPIVRCSLYGIEKAGWWTPAVGHSRLTPSFYHRTLKVWYGCQISGCRFAVENVFLET